MDQKNTLQTEETPLKNRVLKFLIASLIVFVAIKAIFIFVWIPELWGINLLHYVSLPLALLLTLIPLSAIFFVLKWREKPEVQLAKKNSKSKAAKKAPRKKLSDSAILIYLLIGFGILFFSLRISWPFLGDGTVFGGMLFNFQAFGKMEYQWDAAPTTWLLYGIYYLYFKLGNGVQNVFFPFFIVSIISGLLFVWGAFRFACEYDLRPWMRWLFFGLLMCAGGSLYFFRYMEVYSLQYSVILLYLYFAYRFINTKASLLSTGLLLVAAALLHIQNALLLPSFILLYTLRKSDDKQNEDKRRFFLRFILISIPVFLAVYAYIEINFFNLHGIQNLFMPWKNFNGEIYYLLLGPEHLLDIVQEHLLVAGLPIFLIIGCVATSYRKINWKDPYLLFLFMALFYAEALIIGGNCAFGLARDWDISASIGITIALIAIHILKQVYQAGRLRVRPTAIVVPILVTAFCGAVTWIGININERSASSRFEDLMETFTPLIDKRLAQLGYENLRKFYLRFNPNDEIRTERKMIEILPRPPEFASAFRAAALSPNLITAESKSELVRIIRFAVHIPKDTNLKKLEVDTTQHMNIHTAESMTIGDQFEDGLEMMHRDFGAITVNDAINLADTFIMLHPKLPYGYEARGYTMLYYSNKIEASIPYFEKALEKDPGRTRSFLYLAVAHARSKNIIKAKDYFRQMVDLDPDFMEGLKIYIGFMLSLPSTTENAHDLEIIRHALDYIIGSAPESSLQQHLEQHNARVKEAESLKNRVLRKLSEKPVVSSK